MMGGLLLTGWVGYRTYHYFFDDTTPAVILDGIDAEKYCAGNLQCIVKGSDSYNVANLSIWLDDVPLVTKFRINKKAFEHPFTINTHALNNGVHRLRVEAVNGTYRHNRSVHDYSFSVDNQPLQAAFVRPESDLKVFQGRTLHLQFQVNKPIKDARVKLLAQEFKCYPESQGSSIYEAFIPIDCEEQPNEYLLALEIEDHVGNSQTLENKFQVLMFPFKKHTVRVDSGKVQQEEKLGKDDKELRELIAQCCSQSPQEKLWRGAFITPLEMTTQTADFGSIRTTVEKGRYMHKAVDIIGQPKTVVWASQDGIVIAKDRFVQSGNTVVVDHGCGVMSLYCHLDKFATLNVGDHVKKGNPLGIMGKTGFATGDHLHWELVINGIPVDPMQWTKQNF